MGTGKREARLENEMIANEPKWETCKKCKGEGFHHGFGEHGHDPDWCTECDGYGETIVVESVAQSAIKVTESPSGSRRRAIMTCIVCKGNKTVIKQGQEELCYNCFGSGEIKTKGGVKHVHIQQRDIIRA